MEYMSNNKIKLMSMLGLALARVIDVILMT